MEPKFFVKCAQKNWVPNHSSLLRVSVFGVIFCLFVISSSPTNAYSTGPIVDDSLCTEMRPGHGFEPQNGLAQYSITPSKTTVTPGERITVTLAASTRPFKGFLVIGRKVDFLTDKTPQGKFIGEITSEVGLNLGRTGDCLGVSGAAMTHTSSDDKQKVTLEWEAPMESGEYVICVTWVARYDTYWVEQQSEIITVPGEPGTGSSTTSTSTTTTSTAKPTGTPAPGFGEDIDAIYNGCGDTNAEVPKGCFGIPANCIASKSCTLFVTFRLNSDNSAVFELVGKTSGQGETTPGGFVAVGLSRDAAMSDDSVLACRVGSNSAIAVGEYYNNANKGGSTGITSRQNPIITAPAGSYINGVLACSFTVSATYSVTLPNVQQTYVLNSDEYFLLLARGTDASAGYLAKHGDGTENRDAAGVSVKLTSVVIVGAHSKILIELHGSLMVIAWLLCASTGMFTARYYKQTHTEANPFGSAFWFQLHRSCMTLTLVFTVAGFILIFVEIKEITPASGNAEKYHPILGIILTGLALCQVALALFRPHPGARNRLAFNWAHWIIGNSAHIIGLACIYLAKDLAKSNIKGQSKYWGVLTAFVCYHVFLHLLMTYHTVLTDKKQKTLNTKRAISFGPMKPSGIPTEAPGTDIRTIILVMYVAGAAITAVTLIYFIFDALQA